MSHHLYVYRSNSGRGTPEYLLIKSSARFPYSGASGSYT